MEGVNAVKWIAETVSQKNRPPFVREFEKKWWKNKAIKTDNFLQKRRMRHFDEMNHKNKRPWEELIWQSVTKKVIPFCLFQLAVLLGQIFACQNAIAVYIP